MSLSFDGKVLCALNKSPPRKPRQILYLITQETDTTTCCADKPSFNHESFFHGQVELDVIRPKIKWQSPLMIRKRLPLNRKTPLASSIAVSFNKALAQNARQLPITQANVFRKKYQMEIRCIYGFSNRQY